MNDKSIRALYTGDYGYLLGEAPKDERYKKSLDDCIRLQDELRKIVNEEDFDSVIKLMEANNELTDVQIELAFIEGFSLAVHLFTEAFYQN